MTISTVTSAEPGASDARGATIIQFPVPKPAAIPAPAVPEDRLARALANLNAALEQQSVAVTAWREAMGELKATTGGLHDSLRRYSTSLETLGDGVASLRDRARTLEQWADDAMAARE